MKATPEYAETSLIAAGVYLAFCLVSLGVTFYKRSETPPPDSVPLPSGPTPKNIELTERTNYPEYRTPNPAFTQADAGSSLLA